MEAWTGRETAAFRLPPSRLALDPADVVTLEHGGRQVPLRVVAIADADACGIEAVRQDRDAHDLPPGAPRHSALSQAVVFGAPEAVFLELPQPTGLMLRLPSVPDPLPKLPKLKNLVVSFRPTVGGSAFVLGLKERAQVGIFETLCRDVVSAGEGGESREDALCRAIQRTRRGHHLLRGGRQGGLSVEEQRGLVGELEFLRELVSGFAPETAIETWTGPTGSAKDFELIGACVEVTIVHLRFSFGEAVMLVDGVKRFEIGTDIGVALQPDNLMLFDSDGRNISERKPD